MREQTFNSKYCKSYATRKTMNNALAKLQQYDLTFVVVTCPSTGRLIPVFVSPEGEALGIVLNGGFACTGKI